jgi:tRNA A37 methylthiotransferase MiaB
MRERSTRFGLKTYGHTQIHIQAYPYPYPYPYAYRLTHHSPMPRQLTSPASILLCTINAKFIHASLGLRYLMANMARHGDPSLAQRTELIEFTLAKPIRMMVQEILDKLGDECQGQTQVIGLGIYIWNVLQSTELVRELKLVRPQLKVVLGGPEVSHEWESQEIVALADHVITGWGDVSFPKLCKSLIHGPKPLQKIIAGEQPALEEIEFPYSHFSDDDLAHRVLYVEASRGCPFKCEFCLSSLDKTAWAFELQPFLHQLDQLYQRGARNFKFVDRTFNLKIETSIQILQFFLDRIQEASSSNLFVHFEVIPDNLPDRLKAFIARFPPGVLQFEVGIQTFNEEVQKRISRRQDNLQTEENLRWLVSSSNAHLHTDLIMGLPGETLASFADGFDRLLALRPQEIQLGLLKRLRGTPIARHTQTHAMVYDEVAPYTVRQTQDIDNDTFEELTRMAKFWDLVANSGRFKKALALILEPMPPHESAFWSFLHFSQAVWQRFKKSHGLSPEALVDAVFEYLTGERNLPPELVRAHLLEDYIASGARARPRCLANEALPLGGQSEATLRLKAQHQTNPSLRIRQSRHAPLGQ